ncbi:hypothetical protein [Capnocytophaga catalasegens]|uniref:Uncharacterized protein n=1 Tax=Capnocytophaga catalasegens TaxID=1004260 RepID=A0AAV5B1B2_9FLAO|nr:hypothetical protein [Capnocytophaga catalasegens]GIZ16371.1 hypothetical protein RCZ03_23710 [Capnocytophaga catalasegens]GJM51562.1 hypothetical protein RCZ15_25350 [Capnocytophaga catalasegens]GJM54300.1 hypothetical protein RCZ16_26160 [Capnocytophaga catalasegens]
MSEKLEKLKAKNAEKKLLERFHFLEIQEIQNANDENGEKFFAEFRNSGIWNYENQPLATFPFHNENGLIDRNLVKMQHQKARVFFIEKIKKLSADFVWIALSENDFYFFVKVSLSRLCNHLDTWFEKYFDFEVFIPNQYALALHDAEYEWEVL